MLHSQLVKLRIQETFLLTESDRQADREEIIRGHQAVASSKLNQGAKEGCSAVDVSVSGNSH